MKGYWAKTLAIGAIAIATPLIAGSPPDIGKMEYEHNCAVCHGIEGKGNGPYAGIIETKMPDLTTLQKRTPSGVFPFNRVYEMIDGRTEVAGHGPRDMPIWGKEYDAKAAEYYFDYPGKHSYEGYIRGRILALVNHIYMLQEK